MLAAIHPAIGYLFLLLASLAAFLCVGALFCAPDEPDLPPGDFPEFGTGDQRGADNRRPIRREWFADDDAA